MKIEKILMVNTPPHDLNDILNSKRSKSTAKTQIGRFYMPSGLLSIGAYLESKGYTVDMSDMWEMSWEEIESTLKDLNPDIIFSSCLTDSRLSNFKLAKIAKKLNPNVISVVGNAHATAMYDQILRNYPEIDYVVLGEGEITCLELIEHLKYRENFLCSVKGIAYKSNGEIRVTEKRPLANLDEFPFPKKHRFFINEPHTALISTSRGCPYGCTYCSLTKFWQRWRGKSVEKVIEEVDFLVQNGLKHLIFNDDHFTYNKERTMKIVEHFKKYDFTWVMQTRVDKIDKEMYDLFKETRCTIVAFGVESMSPTILKNIHKGYTVEQVKEAFKMGHDAGVPLQANIMIGCTGETENTLNETIQGIKEIKPDIMSKFITMVYPNTKMYELMKEAGKISDDYWLSPNPAPFNTTEHDIETLRKYSLKMQIEWYKQIGLYRSYKEIYDLLKEHGTKFALDYIKDGLSRVRITRFLARTK
jgi:anaerobic magnesium-protoporphyrin IX monomethyl ester cyclase